MYNTLGEYSFKKCTNKSFVDKYSMYRINEETYTSLSCLDDDTLKKKDE